MIVYATMKHRQSDEILLLWSQQAYSGNAEQSFDRMAGLLVVRLELMGQVLRVYLIVLAAEDDFDVGASPVDVLAHAPHAVGEGAEHVVSANGVV